MPTPIDLFLSKLPDAKPTGSGKWMARCPSHTDRNPSLSISETSDGTVLVKCHAHCATESVVAAMGLTMRDLFPPSSNGKPRTRIKLYEPPPEPKGKAYKRVKEALAALDRLMSTDGGVRAGKWSYYDAQEKRVAVVVRYDLPTPDGEKQAKTFRPLSLWDDGWHICDPPGRWPLFRVKGDIGSDAWVVEGEKAASAIAELGLTGIASAHGAGSAHMSDWSPLAGCQLSIAADNDAAGAAYAREVATILRRLGPKPGVKVVPISFEGMKEGDDVVEWIECWRGKGKGDKWLRERLAKDEDTADAGAGAAANTGGKNTQAQQLVRLAVDNGIELFHTADKDAYATIRVDGHEETYKLRAKPFHLWLRLLYHRANKGKVPGAQAVVDALNALEAKALFEGATLPVWTRIAKANGAIYVDLCNGAWQAVEIDHKGWRVVSNPPVKFRRPKAMLEMPTPTEGGSLADLKPFVNVAKSDWPLILGWLVSACRPTGPLAVLFLVGEQGTGKTILATLLRSLIDPNSASTRALPRNEQDLAISANNSRIVSLNNLSYLPDWMSDSLCRLNSGEGFSTRTLFENEDETIFSMSRAIMLNGICEIVTRPDLLDRTITISCPTIDEAQRQDEASFWADFEKVRPGIIGAQFDAVSEGLRSAPVRLDRLPRLADFTQWVVKCERALGVKPGSFLKAYWRNIASANKLALESSPITDPLRALVADQEEWIGTATDLWERLSRIAGEHTVKSRFWPKSPPALGGKLRRLVPNLRKEGIEVEFQADRKQRTIAVRMVAQNAVTAVTP